MDTAPITPKPLVNDKIHSAIGEKEESKEEHQSNHEKWLLFWAKIVILFVICCKIFTEVSSNEK